MQTLQQRGTDIILNMDESEPFDNDIPIIT